MPRLRPPPQQEDEPVIMTVEPLPTDDITIEVDDLGLEPVVIETAAPEVAPKPAVIVPDAGNDDAVRRALDATRHAEDLQRQLNEARQQNVQRDQDLQEAQYNSILTAIGAEQATLEKAESDYAALAAAGDWPNAAKAQSLISKAASRIDRLEDNKQAFDNRREEAKVPRQEEPAKLPARAQDWLASHPEFRTDQVRNNQLGAVHRYLVDVKRVEPFSDAYFESLEAELGLKREAPAPAAPVAAPARRSLPVSAPVSREVPTASGQRASTSMTLTPAEREIARNSFGPIKGPDGRLVDLTVAEKERLYAQNKAKLLAKRASGEYRQTTEQTG